MIAERRGFDPSGDKANGKRMQRDPAIKKEEDGLFFIANQLLPQRSEPFFFCPNIATVEGRIPCFPHSEPDSMTRNYWMGGIRCGQPGSGGVYLSYPCLGLWWSLILAIAGRG
jgi:hypothetical protein